jgi:type VI secretion system secreted protein Hcp
MAYQFYVSMRGQKTGQIKGSVTQKGYEGTIAGLSMSHSIESPLDVRTGLPSGRRMHKPLVFIKAWDKSTPLLFNMFVTNENITQCLFSFVRPSTGAEPSTRYMTIQLTNARIASIGRSTASPDQLNEFDAYDLEEISLTYQKIEITWIDGGITATDDWAGPVNG